MFTGIVEEQGILQCCEKTGLRISAGHILQGVTEKDSIAVDGICLTVTEVGAGWFCVDTMPETIRRTRLASLQPGDRLNLERSLLANGRMGGHMVQGHIEACTSVLETKEDGIGLDVIIALPPHLRPYVIPKCFVALNGVSLTVVDVWHDRFSISLIPYTREHTNLGQAIKGMLLNVETDIVGRYVARFFEATYIHRLQQ
ncbi:riboflavin synthase [Dictyobacter aurantiacus]|uniref:Riboflavin synthase n=1 Tax=Dictyobacter aurantiacus TaxID=1936993 RepID=A0A401Z7A4_9CHLR|nr:riboflavin synthase [Dictyobacter aurantiacus]GCE02719.1 riboflavin synthase subunit alpha [Dictyobacter aurantiacus]